MSDAYNTDGMFGMLNIVDNCLNSIERAIAFDCRDWTSDRRSAWIYFIIFGIDEEDKCKQEMIDHFNWDEDDFKVLEIYHKQWLELNEVAQKYEHEDQCN